MKNVSKEEYAKFIIANEVENKMIEGFKLCAFESYDEFGELIASALYERIAGIVSKTYRIKN